VFAKLDKAFERLLRGGAVPAREQVEQKPPANGNRQAGVGPRGLRRAVAGPYRGGESLGAIRVFTTAGVRSSEELVGAQPPARRPCGHIMDAPTP